MSVVTNVGGFTDSLTATPTITAGAYSSGNLLGGLLTLAGAARVNADTGGLATGTIRTVTLTDKANQKSAVDVVFFVANPTNTTFTDHAAAAINVADLPNVAGHVSIVAGDYISLAASTNAVATKGGLGISYKIPSGSSLYACLICRGTPTYASTSDVSLRVTVGKD